MWKFIFVFAALVNLSQESTSGIVQLACTASRFCTKKYVHLKRVEYYTEGCSKRYMKTEIFIINAIIILSYYEIRIMLC